MTLSMSLFFTVLSIALPQLPDVNSAGATAPFMGTWVFDMTTPDELKGTRETVRIWETDGRIAASFQVGRFPPNNITGILRDGELLVLTTTARENGQPIWVVIVLKRDGDSMMLSQTMERSQTIKRGVGKKLMRE